ncbi:hypothetical protein SK128_011640 [Halocaridina rubra]|uniref:C3H1-type domain-containing protein n=1 Tax=Halocaridina rubra TaxID=373956 RepID=A0AAN8ZS93_HALRR
MAGLVADYGSSSDDENDDEELAEEISSRLTQTRSVNFFESPPEKERDTIVLKSKKKSSAPLAKAPQVPESLDNPLRVNALPSPFSEDSSSSVFFNPFHKAQEDKKLLLEKHVKMTENPRDVLEINGKKICWNYRKGRCKFGHKCKYAHDSDIIQSSEPISESQEGQLATTPNSVSGLCYGDLSNFVVESEPVLEESDAKRKRRAGLSKGLVPSKKAMKIYRDQQAKERPWLVKE